MQHNQCGLIPKLITLITQFFLVNQAHAAQPV